MKTHTKETLGLVFVFVVIGLWAKFNQYEKEEERQRKAEYEKVNAEIAAEMAWKTPVINNCTNAVRAKSDQATLKFDNLYFRNGYNSLGNIEKTDAGYLYHMRVSDASTGNVAINTLCYTNLQGQVVRVVADAGHPVSHE